VGYPGGPPPPPGQIGPRHFPAEAGAYFEEVASRSYPFQRVYPGQDYLAILTTQSSRHALGPTRRADFLRLVRSRLESMGWPELTVTFVAFLVVGRRIG
jgi:hypothetical protein